MPSKSKANTPASSPTPAATPAPASTIPASSTPPSTIPANTGASVPRTTSTKSTRATPSTPKAATPRNAPSTSNPAALAATAPTSSVAPASPAPDQQPVKSPRRNSRKPNVRKNSPLTVSSQNPNAKTKVKAAAESIPPQRVAEIQNSTRKIIAFVKELQQNQGGIDPTLRESLEELTKVLTGAHMDQMLPPSGSTTPRPSTIRSVSESGTGRLKPRRSRGSQNTPQSTPQTIRSVSEPTVFLDDGAPHMFQDAGSQGVLPLDLGEVNLSSGGLLGETRAPSAGLEAKGPPPSDAPPRPRSRAAPTAVATPLPEMKSETVSSVAMSSMSSVAMSSVPMVPMAMAKPGTSVATADFAPVMVSSASTEMRMSIFGPSHPTATGKFLRGRQTKEWEYYSSADNWTNGFGLGVSGGGSRACTSAWGVFSSLQDGGFSRYTTFAFMSCNSGGSWCMLPLLYTPRAGQKNYYQNSLGMDCSVDKMLGDHIPSIILTPDNLKSPLEKYHVGYGTTQMGMWQTAMKGWWNLVDQGFSIPRNIGQGKAPANWQICTFGSSDSEILDEVPLAGSGNITQLAESFKMSARTKNEGYPIPIAVGCAKRSQEKPFHWIYPVEFTPSCSGVFRDENSDTIVDPLDNLFYPDYLVSNALYGAPQWTRPASEAKNQMQAKLPAISTFPRTPYLSDSSLGVNEFMSVTSNAPGLAMSPMEYEMNCPVTLTNADGTPQTKPYKYVDGGAVDNVGLMPLLQRRLAHITVVICNALDFFGPNSPDWHQISDLSRYFTVPTDVLFLSDVTPNPKNKAQVYAPFQNIASCFPSSELLPLFNRLKSNFVNYGTAVATMQHTLAPQQACADYYGLSGPFYKNYKPIVTWYIVQRPQSFEFPSFRNAPFWSNLLQDTRDIYVGLSKNVRINFPYYSTETMLQLDPLHANAMKYYTTAMADYYMLPHLRKGGSPHHVLISSTGQIQKREYFQLENEDEVEIPWIKDVGLSESKQTQLVVSVAYSPLMQEQVYAFADGIQCGEQRYSAPPNTEIKCLLHTVAGIVVGGVTNRSAFLGVYPYIKSVAPTGVILYSIGTLLEILSRAPKDMQQLTCVNYLCARSHIKQGKIPEIAVLGGAKAEGVPLYWHLTITQNQSNQLSFDFAPRKGIISKAPIKLNATKLLVLSDGVEAIWCQDPTNTSLSAVQMLLGKALPVDVNCSKILDVAHCPLLSGILIFFANDANMLSVHLAWRDRFGTWASSVRPAVANNTFMTVDPKTTTVFAKYLGNVFCVRVDAKVYALTTAGHSGQSEFGLSELLNLPFLPAKMF